MKCLHLGSSLSFLEAFVLGPQTTFDGVRIPDPAICRLLLEEAERGEEVQLPLEITKVVTGRAVWHILILPDGLTFGRLL